MCVCVWAGRGVQVSYVMIILICREHINLDSIWDVWCLSVGGQKFCTGVVCVFLCSVYACLHEREQEHSMIWNHPTAPCRCQHKHEVGCRCCGA